MAEPTNAADAVGRAREAALTIEERRRLGAVFTPSDLARRLVTWGTDGWDVDPPWRVLDPACGAGAFLLGAARHQVALGLSADDVLAGLHGWDVDPLSVGAARASLDALFDAMQPPDGRIASPGAVVERDGLREPDDGESFDLVVGNPPFLGQLASSTARSTHAREALARRFGAAANGYVDTAALFLLAALDAVRPGGRVVLVQPESVLGVAHAAAVRDEVLRRADLVGLWVADGHHFAAAVDTCALVLERRAARAARHPGGGASPGGKGRMALAVGVDVVPAASAASPVVGQPSWSPLLARARGVPEVVLDRSAGTIADLATATAGFRQHHYALVPHLVEGGAARGLLAPVVTTGMIDPLVIGWGERSARIGGRRWDRPAVDLAAVEADDATVARWFRARLRPKVLVAPQTRVVEAAVDGDGRCLPATPLVSVEPADGTSGTAWLLAAALSAPPVTAWAHDRSAGTARGRHALKLSARQVLEVPLPLDGERWRAVTADLHAGRPLVDAAPDLTTMYGLAPDHPVVGWWQDQIPS